MLPYLVHIGYAVMILGFMARDILVLRAVLAAAQIILALYAFGISVPAITAWNAVLATINTSWAMLILHERRQVQVPPELQGIHGTQFTAMTAAEFLRWWKLGRTESMHDAALTRDGVDPTALYFILDGHAQVRRADAVIAELSAGCFVAEMSLITGKPANADVFAQGVLRVQRWARRDLHDLRTRDLGMWIKVQSAIGSDLVRKIERGAARVADK
jgi:hypothetical protein